MENKTQNSISFILDGKTVEIDFSKTDRWTPTTTVLNYLRSLPTHKGVKEGCAEGDCGACSVAIAEVDPNNKMKYRAFDSCLVFLPMLHGKQLITVENLGTHDKLHPVQKAMVETDGSQCGYCTPGFVMAMFALYKNSNNPSREQIDDALTGNLCRCTGYRPIVEAAAQACVHNGKDQFTETESSTQSELSKIDTTTTVAISTDRQQYWHPFTLSEALRLRAENPDAILINGATDIALRVTKNKELLKNVIDLSGVKEFKQFEETTDALVFGSGLSLEEVKQKSEAHFPALTKMLAVFGSLQIRNIATLGGNIGTASPIGDTPPVLMALDAVVHLKNQSGERQIPIREFITGYRATQIKPDELILGVSIPKTPAGVTVSSYKISKRKDLDISTVSSGFRLQLDDAGNVKDVVLAFGGVAAMTKRAEKTEAFLKGKAWERSTVDEAMPILESEFTPITDARSGAEARRIMAKNLLLKFWAETAGVAVTA